MDFVFNLVIVIVLALIIFIALYFVIKKAVRDAILEIMSLKESSKEDMSN